MKKLMLVVLALSMVLVGCGERDDNKGAKEKQNGDEEQKIRTEDYIEFKDTYILGDGTFYSVTSMDSDLLGVSDYGGPNEGYKGVVEKVDSEGNSQILFQAPKALKGKEYGFNRVAVLENNSYLVSGWSLQTVDDFQVERKELLIFGADNKIKSSITLSSEVVDLFEAEMLSSNEYLVAVQKDTGVNFVQKLDDKGNVVKEIEQVSSFLVTEDNKVVIVDASSVIVLDSDLNELLKVDLDFADESGKTKHIVTSLMNASDGNIILGFDIYHIDEENPDEVGTIDMALASISVEGQVNWHKVVAGKSVSNPNSLVEYNGNYIISGYKEHDGPERLYVIGAYSKDGKELGAKYIKGGFSTFNRLAVIGDKLFIVSTQREEREHFQRALCEISWK